MVGLKKYLPSLSVEISDSRDPRVCYHLDIEHPDEIADYFYQVRSNLSHRGKGAFSDGEIVRKSLCILIETFKNLLNSLEASCTANQSSESVAPEEEKR